MAIVTDSHPESNSFERTAFQTSRALDFFSEVELSAQTGHSRAYWPEMVLKELLDNALDAAEQSDEPPDIKIDIDRSSLTVTDNGPGIPKSTLAACIDYSRRVSTNAKYISPTRGTQGLGLKGVIAAPFVLDGNEAHISIATPEAGYRIDVRVDPIAQEPLVDLIDNLPPREEQGTSMSVCWPENTDVALDDTSCEFLEAAHNYAFLNPHTDITMNCPQGSVRYHRTRPDWKKWMPSDRTPAQWYSVDELSTLIAGYIHHDQTNGRARTLRDFISEFHGLKSSAKQKAVLNDVGLAGERLSVLANGRGLNRRKVAKLLKAMQEHSQEPKPDNLGVIGKDHLRHRIEEIGGDMDRFKYKRLSDVSEEGLPFVVEAAFAQRLDADEVRKVIAGVNWSPSVGHVPFEEIGDQWMLDEFLVEQEVRHSEPVILFLHLATPKVYWEDTGKTSVSLMGDTGHAVREALRLITRDWQKKRRAERAEQVRRRRRHQEHEKQRRKENSMDLNDACFLKMRDALEHVTGGGRIDEFPSRNLFYSIRKLIGGLTNKTLKQNYFNTILNEWEKRFGTIDSMYRDPRGHLVEPHTNKVVRLGTREVKQYQIPAWHYHTIFSVEKKGFGGLFREAQIAELYDMAIISAEGYMVDAAKMLMAEAQEQNIKLLCLHDADPYGMNIYRNLCEETLRSPNIEVIDLGLHLEEAFEMGLEPEPFTYTKALPKGLEFTEVEREHFVGEYVGLKDGKPEYRGWRVELNDLASDPDQFISYIKRKLHEHGVDQKLVPPEQVIEEHARAKRQEMLQQRVRGDIEQRLDIPNLVDRVASQIGESINIGGIPSAISEWAETPKPEHWTAAVADELEAFIDTRNQEIRSAIDSELQS